MSVTMGFGCVGVNVSTIKRKHLIRMTWNLAE